MAQDWIKIETHTISKVEIARIASALKFKRLDRFGVLGRLIVIWSYFDSHTYDGTINGVGPDYLDELVGTPGFCDAMKSVGWIAFEGDKVTLPNFDRHNGETAKARAMAAKRMAKYRNKSDAPSATKVRGERNKCYAPSATDVPEKRNSSATEAQPGASPDEIREEEEKNPLNPPLERGEQKVHRRRREPPKTDEEFQAELLEKLNAGKDGLENGQPGICEMGDGLPPANASPE